jgi:hypothetical protein
MSQLRIAAALLLAVVSANGIAAGSGGDAWPAGLPALSREWHGADYQAVAAAIDSGAVALPKFSSESGARILTRLTAVKNLDLAQNKAVPIASRMQDVLAIDRAWQSIAPKYLTSATRGEKVGAELAVLLAFQLHVSAIQLLLANEFVPQIPHDDKYAARLDGLRMLRTGVTNIFLGADGALSARDFYSAADQSLLLQAMADTLPALKSAFAPDVQQELRGKLQAQRKTATQPGDLRNFDVMLAELKG